MELLVVRNPDPTSSLPYLVRVPLGGGLMFRTKGTWPRTGALYCHPVGLDEWPENAEIIERVSLRACARRGAAIDVICDRGRERRSQIVFTRARGRDVVFWQSPRTRKQSRPDVRLPSARAASLEHLEIFVDAHERYPFKFAAQQAQTVRRGLACGDYAVSLDGIIACAVERKSVSDLAGSLLNGRLRYQVAELASLPRAAVVVEQSYARVFGLEHTPGAAVADGLAELQIRWPTVPIVFCENRKLAEDGRTDTWPPPTSGRGASPPCWRGLRPPGVEGRSRLQEPPVTRGPRGRRARSCAHGRAGMAWSSPIAVGSAGR